MKSLLLIFLSLVAVSCASKKEIKTDAGVQVLGLQKMCKDSTPDMQARQSKKSLYLRLGKKKQIRKLSQTILKAHKANKEIKHLVEDIDDARFVQNVTMFLVTGTGGKGKYEGASMKDAHSHLNISNANFLAAGSDVQESMKSMKYGENEIQEVVCALVAFIPDVVIR